MKIAHCETYNEIIRHFVKSNFNSAETVISVINEHFDHFQRKLVVCRLCNCLDRHSRAERR